MRRGGVRSSSYCNADARVGFANVGGAAVRRCSECCWSLRYRELTVSSTLGSLRRQRRARASDPLEFPRSSIIRAKHTCGPAVPRATHRRVGRSRTRTLKTKSSCAEQRSASIPITNPMSHPSVAAPAPRKNVSGGSAVAGGTNFHARVATVAAAYLLARRPLGWLKELELDIPKEIWCETNGPGDDLRLVLANGSVVEAQAKKGLSRGNDLWTALAALAHGIHTQTIAYGVLVIDAEASTTIRHGLARDIVRLGDGRADSLDNISIEFKSRLDAAGLPVEPTCGKLRIVVAHCADHDDASEAAAKSELSRLCAAQRDAIAAWQALQLSAHGLIERKGRWTTESLTGVMRSAAVELRYMPGDVPLAPVSGCVWEHLDDISQHRSSFCSYFSATLPRVESNGATVRWPGCGVGASRLSTAL